MTQELRRTGAALPWRHGRGPPSVFDSRVAFLRGSRRQSSGGLSFSVLSLRRLLLWLVQALISVPSQLSLTAE